MTAKKVTPRNNTPSSSAQGTDGGDDSGIPPDFERSPLPTPEFHATLAARLISGKPDCSQGDIANAVEAAARLWGAVLACDTEFSVEAARRDHCEDKEQGEARWRLWWEQRQSELAAAARERARQTAGLDRKAKTVFRGLTWPASYPDVLRRILKGAPEDGNDQSRHEEFSMLMIKSIMHGFPRRESPPLPPAPPAPGEALNPTRIARALERSRDRAREQWEKNRPDFVDERLAVDWLGMYERRRISSMRSTIGKRGGTGRKRAAQNG